MLGVNRKGLSSETEPEYALSSVTTRSVVFGAKSIIREHEIPLTTLSPKVVPWLIQSGSSENGAGVWPSRTLLEA